MEEDSNNDGKKLRTIEKRTRGVIIEDLHDNESRVE